MDLGNPLLEVEDVEESIYLGWAKSDLSLAEGFADMKAFGMELDSAVNISGAEDIAWLIFNQREVTGEGL